MDIKYLGDDLVEIDGKVRVESGPRRRREIATPELLSDAVTAAHYSLTRTEAVFDAAGRPTGGTKTVPGRDALGQEIRLGEPMDFIDWLSPAKAFYVYQLTEVTEKVEGKPVKTMRWMPVADPAIFDDEDAALSRATTLAASLAA